VSLHGCDSRTRRLRVCHVIELEGFPRADFNYTIWGALLLGRLDPGFLLALNLERRRLKYNYFSISRCRFMAVHTIPAQPADAGSGLSAQFLLNKLMPDQGSPRNSYSIS
jgi:hypothetical protein